MSDLKVPCNVKVDFDVNEDIKSQLGRERKLGNEPPLKEDYYGQMIKERHDLEKALKYKKMTFKELLTWLRKV